MRILLLHNCYRQPGGEDAVVAAERALLRDNGHEVRLFEVDNDAISGLGATLRTAWRAANSEWGRAVAAREIDLFRPEIVHVHNFFPLLSPSVYSACRSAGVPVVQTLHNYRLICPGGLLLRGGQPCVDCIGATPWRAVLHRCYRGSAVGSAIVAHMVDVHRRSGTWLKMVDRFIALSGFAKSKFAAGGLPADRIFVKPNFVSDREAVPDQERNGALYVGRLSPEKGIATLIDGWRSSDISLRAAGDGPLMEAALRSRKLEVLGHVSSQAVADEMRRAAFLIMPSICYENFPLTIIEAFSHGLPVIASRLGAMAEIVEDGKTGLLFEPGSAIDLARKARWAADHPEEMARMGKSARRTYERLYTPERNYAALMAIYESALKRTPAPA